MSSVREHGEATVQFLLYAGRWAKTPSEAPSWAPGRVPSVEELLGRARDRLPVHLGTLDRAHRAGHLDRHSAQALLE
jgi:hypothetical protein